MIIIGFSILLYYSLENTINKEVKKQLTTQASYIYQELDDIDFQKQIIISDLEIAIKKNNQIIYKTKNFNTKKLDLIHNLNKESFFLIKNNHGEDALFIQKFNQPYKGTIYLLKRDIHQEVNQIKVILLILNPILLLSLLLLTNKLINKVFITIKTISSVAKEISITNFNQTIPLPNDDNEIKELVVSFNNMVERLKEGIERLERFNNDVSHELKTPLTVILGEVEVTLRKQRDSTYYIKTLHTIGFEARQLNKMTKDLLMLTQYSKEDIKYTFYPCDLDALLLNAIDKYEKELKKKKYANTNCETRINKLQCKYTINEQHFYKSHQQFYQVLIKR